MLRADLEVEAHERAFGTGWISGVLALACALFGLGAVLFMMLPGVFTMPMLREQYSQPWFRLALHFILIGAFVLGDAAKALADAADPVDDLQGSGEYKRHLIGVFLKRAFIKALA
jgi:hypothetical protein